MKSFIALHVIIGFYITRSIDHTCKAVSQPKLTELRNFHLPCNFRVFRSAYSGFMSLNHLRTSGSVALTEQKLCRNLVREVHFLQILHVFCSPYFPWVFDTRCITEHGMQYQNRAVDLLEEFEWTEQQGGDKGIKKNNLKNKCHERIYEII